MGFYILMLTHELPQEICRDGRWVTSYRFSSRESDTQQLVLNLRCLRSGSNSGKNRRLDTSLYCLHPFLRFFTHPGMRFADEAGNVKTPCWDSTHTSPRMNSALLAMPVCSTRWTFANLSPGSTEQNTVVLPRGWI